MADNSDRRWVRPVRVAGLALALSSCTLPIAAGAVSGGAAAATPGRTTEWAAATVRSHASGVLSVALKAPSGPEAPTSRPQVPTAPARPAATPARLAATPARPAATPARSTATPARSTATPARAGDPLAGLSWYVPHPADVEAAIAGEQAAGDTAAVAALDVIADHENAVWLTGGGDPASTVAGVVHAAALTSSVPVLVVYAIPDRDCGGYSSGGEADAAAYASYVEQVASGLGGHRAVVDLEPDALAQGVTCLDAADQAAREAMVAHAVGTLSAAGALVYIDAGNADWLPARTIAPVLEAAGVGHAAGFALDTSGFDAAASEDAYGNQVSAALHGAHFVVDTSRDGSGSAPGNEWCNPAGRALGVPATTATGDALADADLWFKTPGESDGTCNGGPAAGQWWTAYAVGLAERAGY